MKPIGIAVWLALGAGCAAGTTTSASAAGPTAESSQPRHVPAKCTACHLAPAEHSLAVGKWAGYLKAHRRRLRLTTDDEAFLHDFLVGPPLQAE
jgi:hypothetical protein